jgi:hypothetical protein
MGHSGKNLETELSAFHPLKKEAVVSKKLALNERMKCYSLIDRIE